MNNNFIIVSLMVIFILSITLSSNIWQNTEGQTEDLNILTPSQSNITNIEKFETYQNSKYGIKIEYPANWLKTEPGSAIGNDRYKQINVVTFSSPPNNDPVLMVIVANKTTGTLTDFASEGINQHRIIYSDFNLLKLGNVKLGDNPGYNFIFNASDPNGKFTAAQIWTIKDNKLYLIVNTVSEHLYPLTWPIIQRMVDSFEIVN
ncbi:MAG TPA: PsbP-related protein [Nitrososphaeraceae archaeon]|nr:PsbP-related protein [Nitrososphaeraceae archaeon]